MKSAEVVAFENDLFRKRTPGLKGKYYFSEGVQAMLESVEDKTAATEKLFQLLADSSEFTKDNDPYGERDFGVFYYDDKKLWFKIDYMDPQTGYWSDPKTTNPFRILTILFPSEY